MLSFTSDLQERVAVAQIARSLGVLVRSGHRLRARADRAGPATGVRWSAYPVLSALVELGPQRVTDLAERLHLAPSSMSRAVQQLVEAGLVDRLTDAADGRAARVVVTAAGRQAFERMILGRDLAVREALAGWSDEDRNRLALLLPRLVGALELDLPAPAGADEPARRG